MSIFPTRFNFLDVWLSLNNGTIKVCHLSQSVLSSKPVCIENQQTLFFAYMQIHATPIMLQLISNIKEITKFPHPCIFSNKQDYLYNKYNFSWMNYEPLKTQLIPMFETGILIWTHFLKCSKNTTLYQTITQHSKNSKW